MLKIYTKDMHLRVFIAFFASLIILPGFQVGNSAQPERKLLLTRPANGATISCIIPVLTSGPVACESYLFWIDGIKIDSLPASRNWYIPFPMSYGKYHWVVVAINKGGTVCSTSTGFTIADRSLTGMPLNALLLRKKYEVETYLGPKERVYKINVRDIYCKGGKWVQDMTLNWTVSRYVQEILLTKNANLNLLRIWGPGGAPPEVFNESADEHGIMHWQNYLNDSWGTFRNIPGYSSDKSLFKQSITRRYRNRQSLVIWSSGNKGPNPREEMIVNDILPAQDGKGSEHHLRISNCEGLALMTLLKVIDPISGAEVLPTTWSDNYVSPFPGEEKVVHCSVAGQNLPESMMFEYQSDNLDTPGPYRWGPVNFILIKDQPDENKTINDGPDFFRWPGNGAASHYSCPCFL